MQRQISLSSLPQAFIDKLSKLYSVKQNQTILASFSKPTTPCFRLNPLKANSHTLQNLTQQGFHFALIDILPDTYFLTTDTIIPLSHTQEFTNGEIYLQNPSSIFASLILDPQPDQQILDIAAAPGSKTSHLAALMQNSGQIIANDLSKNRIYQLSRVLYQLGVTNTKTSLYPGQYIWRKYPNFFDKTLVDAPCSMEGMFRSFEPKSYTHWSPKKVKLLAQRQKHLLRSAISATKPGGIIVYSTCTISIEENEEVIDWILCKEPTLIVEPINLNIPNAISGFTQSKKTLDPRLSNTRRILPNQIFEAFFIAKLRKAIYH